MSKVILQIISIIALLALFGLTYALVKDIERPAKQQIGATDSLEGFSNEQQTVGQVGGVHYLQTGDITDNQQFKRLTFSTETNRASVLDDTIATPYTTTHLVLGDQPYIDIVLADTTRTDSTDGPAKDIYTGIKGLAKTEDAPITKVDVLESTEGGQEIKIFLTDTTKKFRLGSDPQNPSNIWIDILK